MKRMHVGIRVKKLQPSVDFYTRLFGKSPTLEKLDYAKWMLDDPYINFSLIVRSGNPGLHHIGFQLESMAELEGAREHLAASGLESVSENELACGYQIQSKSWVHDPQGVAFEHFYTHGVVAKFGMTTEYSPKIQASRQKALLDSLSGTAGKRG